MARKRRDILAHRDVYTLAAIVLFIVLCVLFRRFSIDDAFITYRYALHLSEGLGPVMNVGERVEGVSNLPWAGLLGLVSAAGLEPHSVGPFLSVICGFLCIGFVAELAARWSADERAGGVASLLFASAAPLAVWSLSGMETLAYTLLLILLFLRAGSGVGRRGHGLDVGILLGFVASMRPEGALFALPILLAERTAAVRVPGRLWRIAAGALVVLVPLEIFRLLYYADWLPNTVHAKATVGTSTLTSGLLYVGKTVVAFPLFFVGLWHVARNLEPRHLKVLLLGWVLLQLLFTSIVGGERFPGYRFLMPVLPALAVGAELTLRSWRQSSMKVSPARWLAMGFAFVVGVGLCVAPGIAHGLGAAALGWLRTYEGAAVHSARLASEARFLGVMLAAVCLFLGYRLRARDALADVEPVLPRTTGKRKTDAPARVVHESNRARQAMAMALALWWISTLLPVALDPSLRLCRQPDPAARLGRVVGEWLRNNTPQGTLIATNAAGSLAYFSERPVVDMLGLTDAHIAHRGADPSQWIGHEKGDGLYVLERRPDMIILGGAEGSESPWPFPGDQEIAASALFARDYELQRVALEDFDFVYYRRHDGRAPRAAPKPPESVRR